MRATPASISWQCCRRNLAARFAAAAAAAGIHTAADDNWGDIFSRVLVEKIEPRLGVGRATVLVRISRVQSPLARPSPSDPRLAERFELYACGVELANGFGELTDAVEQRKRLEEQMAEKERIYGERYPIDEDFLAALAVMPPACGVALGFDRLVMLATGAHAHRAGAVDANARKLNDRSEPGRERCWRFITMTCRSARRR